MFTWNFQYVSKARLAETFGQLSLNSGKGDILIRIHTAIHNEMEAVELAGFVKELVPGANIIGTSTSAVITNGRLVQNQCVISVSQMVKGSVETAMLPTFFEDRDEPIGPDDLCMAVRDTVVSEHTKLVMAFTTDKYLDIQQFVEKCNDYLPGVQMIGGLANSAEGNLRKLVDSGFVFNEKSWSSRSILLASVSGEDYEVLSSFASGAQEIGEEIDVTESFGTCILEMNDDDAARKFREGAGEAISERPELADLLPFVYSDTEDAPFFVHYRDGRVHADHNIQKGKKIKRAFVYDRKVVIDNRKLFRRVENFEKAETIFGYTSAKRAKTYANSSKWELSAYENSNLCGCALGGEIVHVSGKNAFASGTFVVSVMGEVLARPQFNSYVFSHVESLVADNQKLLSYLMEIEEDMKPDSGRTVDANLQKFVRDCEANLLYSEEEDLPNTAALNMDMKIRGYDRICMIQVSEIASMKAVFPEQMIGLTYRNFIGKCAGCAEKRGYHIYMLDTWQLAIAAPSYMVKLSEFTSDMENLQRELFETTSGYIAIVPGFCVIDNCTVDTVYDTYSTARMEMAQKNIQFLVYDAGADQLDEESIRERYHMVNVINYAIAHDKIIPYFQGIYDNGAGRIHHYESLMRLMDEDGRIYYPGDFLDVARSYGLLYDSISLTMVSKVFEMFKNSVNTSVSVNLGIRDIKNQEMTEMIYDFLPTVDHPENFVFEILENEDVDDYEYVVSFVDRVHGLGGRISIDDFGSGYSNLQHVLSIQADYLKLDGSIIRNCTVDRDSENLVALMGGWRDLSARKMQIIAEYVENEEIQQKMKMYGIDFSQGYLFSKPSPEIGAIE
ncbi:MAG: EAL domain-containing protein [Eubacterium sp.]|nr:EAL domain-containing protein [Eubacterium sp.]